MHDVVPALTSLAMWALLAGCAVSSADKGTHTDASDTDADDTDVDDTDVDDTDGHSDADTDLPPDTDLHSDADTDPPPDTDTDGHSDVATDLPVDTDDTDDTDIVVPPQLTGGFTAITGSIWAGGDWFLVPEPPDNGVSFPGYGVPAWGDADGDGIDEFVTSGARDVLAPHNGRWHLAFRPDGQGGWTFLPDLSEALSAETHEAIAAIIDLDGDGDDDILRQSVRETAIQLVDNGQRTWATIEEPPGVFLPYGANAPMLADFDQDGWLDIVQGSDPCSYSPATPRVLPMLRTGPSTWTHHPEMIPERFDANPYAFLLTNLGGPTDVLVFLGDPCNGFSTHPGFYLPSLRGADGYARFYAQDLIPADAAYRQTPQGAAAMVTHKQPMGGASVDINADGLLDLMIAPSDDHLYLFRGTTTFPLVDATLSQAAPLEYGPAGDPKLPWGAGVMDVDLDGWPDLLVGRGDDNRTFFGSPYNGPYQPSLFRNVAGQGFEEIRDQIGLDTFVGETQTVVLFDIDGDHDRDLLLGGIDLFPSILRNDLVPPGHRLPLRLQGTTSNHLGIGATVQVLTDGLPNQTRLVGGEASPHTVHDPLLVMAGGMGPTVDLTRIVWPTGYVQELIDLDVDMLHTITEPPLITLSEASRHAPADGSATIDVVVTPRTPSGDLDPAATVTIELSHGAGTWLGHATSQAGTWTRQLQAPSAAGFALILVTIDGVPVRIQPRIWWDAP